MFPIRVKISSGTLDIKEYDFKNDSFIGSNNKKYSINEIEYFIIPTKEIKKILSLSDENTKNESETKTETMIKTDRRARNYSK